MNPYTDKNNIREFSSNVDELDLVWHQDKEDRLVEVLEGEGWKFQRDNQLPVLLISNQSTFRVKAEEYHRIIKGDEGPLVLYIEEK